MRTVFAFALILIGMTTASFASIGKANAESEADSTRNERLTKQMELATTFAKIEGMKSVVRHLAANGLACETAADCTSLAMGKRACGGPTSYVVTSFTNPSLSALQESIQLVTKAEIEANTKFGLASICSLIMPPRVACHANQSGERRCVNTEEAAE